MEPRRNRLLLLLLLLLLTGSEGDEGASSRRFMVIAYLLSPRELLLHCLASTVARVRIERAPPLLFLNEPSIVQRHAEASPLGTREASYPEAMLCAVRNEGQLLLLLSHLLGLFVERSRVNCAARLARNPSEAESIMRMARRA